MHKLFLRIILLALSACGDGGSDAVNTSITAAATKQAEAAGNATALKALEDAAINITTQALASRNKEIADAERLQKLNTYGESKYENQKFQ